MSGFKVGIQSVVAQYRKILVHYPLPIAVCLGAAFLAGGLFNVQLLKKKASPAIEPLAVKNALISTVSTHLNDVVLFWPPITSLNAEDIIAQEDIIQDETPPSLTPAQCFISQLTDVPLAEYAGITQIWGRRLNQHVQESITQWTSTLATYTRPEGWPDIHEQARKAKVPVIMYHDVLAETQVYFDITPEHLAADFQLIKDSGLTPISLDQLVTHLRTGAPLPEKPVLLTFDDGYSGHYDYAFRLMKQYQYPAAFSVFTGKLDGDIIGRSTITWEQVETMAADPLVTIVSHTVHHPRDLRELSDEDLVYELQESKRRLERRLGIPIHYFTYPEGNRDERVIEAVQDAGYFAGLAMDKISGDFANASDNLFTVERFGEVRLEEVIQSAWGGPPLPRIDQGFNFGASIQFQSVEVDDIPMTLISGGQPKTIHADSRYPLVEIVAETDAVAAVDGTFFSLEFLDSRTMIGPVLSENTGEFVPGSSGDVPKLRNRPLVLVSPTEVRFIPFKPHKHNSLEGVQAEMPDVTDAFVAAAWLVKDGEAPPAKSYETLPYVAAPRNRAFWGINQAGQPMIGVTHRLVDTIGLSERLTQVGFREAVMLDSGVSTDLVYEGESYIGFESRPIPHAILLHPPQEICPQAEEDDEEALGEDSTISDARF